MATITSTELGASGRYINLGSPASHDNLGAQTVAAYVRPTTGSSGATDYIIAKAGPAAAGFRLMAYRANDSTVQFALGFDSSGAALAPRRNAASVAGGTWTKVLATFDGSLLATGIKIYLNGTESGSYAEQANGSGTLTADDANDLLLLNRSDLARSFLGDVAYIARWNRVLSAAEIASVTSNGPLSVPDGLILCWANQEDNGPLDLVPTARTTYVAGAIPPDTNLGESADTTAPTLTSPTATATGTTTAVGAVSTNEASGTLYWLASTNATETVATVKAGSSQAVTTTGSQAVSVTGLIASSSYRLHFVHRDAAGNDSAVASSALFNTPAEDDTTPPVLTGAVSFADVTQTSYTVIWPAGSDDTGIAGYEYQIGGTGGAWTDAGADLSEPVSGRTPGATETVYVRAYDAAGNRSTPPISGSVTLLEALPALQMIHVGDSLNTNPTGSSITGADTASPSVTIKVRAQSVSTPGPWPESGSKWRNFLFRLQNAAGKIVSFRLNPADYVATITASWRPWYSYDNVTWQRWPTAPVLNSGFWEFGGVEFTSDTVHIGFQPGYPMSRVLALIAELAASHPDYVHPLRSTGPGWVARMLPAQTDELGNTVPSQPFYSYGIWDRTAFPDDGTPKRTVIVTNGTHPGEHVGDWMLEGFLRYLCSSDAKAVALRKNFQFFVYPNVNPTGRYGGHWRGQWEPTAPTKNSNRDFSNYYGVEPFQLPSSRALRDALILDASGRSVVFAMDFHGQQNNPVGKPAAYWYLHSATDPTYAANFQSRMRAYDAGYTGESAMYASSLTVWLRDTYGVEHAYFPEAYEQRAFEGGTNDFFLAGEHFAKAIADTFAAAAATETPFIGKSLALDFVNAPAPGPVSVSIWDGVPGHGGTLLSADKLGVDSSGKLRADASAATGLQVFALVTDEIESAATTRSFAASVTLTTVP